MHLKKKTKQNKKNINKRWRCIPERFEKSLSACLLVCLCARRADGEGGGALSSSVDRCRLLVQRAEAGAFLLTWRPRVRIAPKDSNGLELFFLSSLGRLPPGSSGPPVHGRHPPTSHHSNYHRTFNRHFIQSIYAIISMNDFWFDWIWFDWIELDWIELDWIGSRLVSRRNPWMCVKVEGRSRSHCVVGFLLIGRLHGGRIWISPVQMDRNGRNRQVGQLDAINTFLLSSTR